MTNLTFYFKLSGVVLCYGLERGNPEILAFVTIKPEARIAAQHIEAALKNSLTHYMIPQVIFHLHNILSHLSICESSTHVLKV